MLTIFRFPDFKNARETIGAQALNADKLKSRLNKILSEASDAIPFKSDAANRLIGAYSNWLPKFQTAYERIFDDSIYATGLFIHELIKQHILKQSNLRRKSGATGPRHLDPKKVRLVSSSPITGILIQIDIPGISRAYHPITIRPKHSKYLAIPLKPQYGAARTFAKDLFFYKTKAGNKALAYVSSGKLVVTHILKESVFQPKDPTLLPDPKTLERMIGRFSEAETLYKAEVILNNIHKYYRDTVWPARAAYKADKNARYFERAVNLLGGMSQTGPIIYKTRPIGGDFAGDLIKFARPIVETWKNFESAPSKSISFSFTI